MSDAYKVGITVALTNKISQGLMLIRGDLAKTDIQAKKLHATLNQIKLLGIGGAILGGAGFMGLRALDKTLDAAKEYQQALAQFKSLNLGDVVNSQADKFARGSSVIGASATDLMTSLRDLTTVFGDRNIDITRQLAPGLSQLKFANHAIYGGHGLDFNEGQLRSLEKIIEMKGGFKSAPDFLAQASMMQQVIAGTGGMVKPSDYLAFIKTSGVSGRLLSEKSFYYGMEPLIQEMGGSRVGTALMSAYNNLAQGRTTVRAATEMMKLGLIDPSMVEYTKIGTIKRVKPGALKGMDEFTTNPFGWLQDVLLPTMAKKGITSRDDIINEIGAILTNRTGASLFSLMFLQQEKIAKNMKLSQGAMNTEELVKLARTSPQGAEEALGKAWETLKIAAGEALIPVIIPAMNKLADVLRAIGQWATRHPRMFDMLIYGFAGLSAALLFSGAVLTLKAAFLGISLIMPTLAGTITASVVPALVLLSAALVPLAALAYHKEASNWIDKQAPWIGDSLFAVGDYLGGYNDRIRNAPKSFPKPPPASKNPTEVTVNLDGRVIAKSTSGYQYDAWGKAVNSGSSFDYRQSFAAVAP